MAVGKLEMILGALANFPECRIDALEEMLKHKDCVIGLGDGGAHYGAICAGAPMGWRSSATRDRR